MKIHILPKLITLSMLLLSGLLDAKQLIVHSSIPGRTPSDQFTCRVREVGTEEWENAFVIQTTCKKNPDKKSRIKGPNNDNGYFDNLAGWSASYIAIEFEGMDVEVEVTKISGPITKAKVRPVTDAGAAAISEGKARFIMTKNANVNIDINGQMEDQYTGQGYEGPAVHTFTVFGNPVYTAPGTGKVVTLKPGQDIRSLNRDHWDAIRFAPGIHKIGKAFEILSNEVFYIPGDAIVHGTFQPKKYPNHPKNWKVYGSGALSGEEIDWIGDDAKENKPFTNDSEGAHLEGFVVIDSANHTFNMYNPGSADNLYINLKVFGWRKNSDGLNAFRNSLIKDCFFRVQDDVFYLGKNVRISNITTWNDSNGAVMYLTNSSSSSRFEDIKVIYHRAMWHYWGGGRVISMRDCEKSIENVHFKNIVVEDPYPAFGLFFLEVKSGAKDLNFNNIVFENIRQEAKEVGEYKKDQQLNPVNTLFGGNSSSILRNITFKNVFYAGKHLRSLEDGDFITNSYVDRDSIRFTANPSSQ